MIECHKTETEVITSANQKKGTFSGEPMRTQGKNKQTAQSAGNAADQLVIGVSLAFDWLKEWREFSGPITLWNKVKPMQFRVTFDTQTKIALLLNN